MPSLFAWSALTHSTNSSSAKRATGVRSFQENGMPVWSGVVKRFESVMTSVCASPFLPFTCRKPSAPAPPDLLTTTTGRGDSFDSSAIAAMSRAIWSAPPPVPAGTMSSMGRVGSHADATPANARMRTTTAVTILMSHLAVRGSRDANEGRAPDPPRSPPLTLLLGRFAATLLRGERCLRCVQPTEGHDARDLPLVPLLVDLRLEIGEILFGEVREPSLLEEVLPHGLARPPLDDR